MAIETVGVIGLGAMGRPMSRHMVKAGYTVVGYDIDSNARKRASECGLRLLSSSKEVARESDLIMIVVGFDQQVDAVHERAHHGLSDLIPVETMHQRKQQMAQLADAFVALPGGIGTLEEVIEVFTWLQLGLHLKPVGLLNVRGFYDLLLQFLAHMRDEQFLTLKHYSMLTVSTDVECLLDDLTAAKHIHVPKPIYPASPSPREMA